MGLFRKTKKEDMPPPPPPFEGSAPLPPAFHTEEIAQPQEELPSPPPQYIPQEETVEETQEPVLDLEPETIPEPPSVEEDPLHIPPISLARPIKEKPPVEIKPETKIDHNPAEMHPAPIEPRQYTADTTPYEEESHEEEFHHAEILDEPQTPSPLFVSANDYQTILSGIEGIKKRLGETEGHVARVLDIKQRQERVIDDWRHHLEDVQKRLSYVDEVIFRAK